MLWSGVVGLRSWYVVEWGGGEGVEKWKVGL